jgi:hypothetical protein
MSEKFSINKSTTISVSIVTLLVGATFFIARLEATTSQHTKDIATLAGRIDKQIEVNEEQNDINQELNENIIRLNARLDTLGQGPISSAAAAERTTARVVVVNNPGMQPTTPTQNTQTNPPAPQEPEPEPSSPEYPQQLPLGNIGDALQQSVDVVLSVIRR